MAELILPITFTSGVLLGGWRWPKSCLYLYFLQPHPHHKTLVKGDQVSKDTILWPASPSRVHHHITWIKQSEIPLYRWVSLGNSTWSQSCTTNLYEQNKVSTSLCSKYIRPLKDIIGLKTSTDIQKWVQFTSMIASDRQFQECDSNALVDRKNSANMTSLDLK